jgi:hypothetical protein
MEKSFRYVFNDNLYHGYCEGMPLEDGKKVFRITYPDHADQFGQFFEVIETGNHHSPYRQKTAKEFDPFYSIIIKWFADYELLSG